MLYYLCHTLSPSSMEHMSQPWWCTSETYTFRSFQFFFFFFHLSPHFFSFFLFLFYFTYIPFSFIIPFSLFSFSFKSLAISSLWRRSLQNVGEQNRRHKLNPGLRAVGCVRFCIMKGPKRGGLMDGTNEGNKVNKPKKES